MKVASSSFLSLLLVVAVLLGIPPGVMALQVSIPLAEDGVVDRPVGLLDTKVFFAALTGIGGVTQVGGIAIVDDGTPVGGGLGIFSGFDVDGIFLDEDGDLATSHDRVFASSFLFTAGTLRPTTDPRFLPMNGNPPGPTFGSLDANTVDLSTATLNDLDAFFEGGGLGNANTVDGFLTLGDGGTLIANFTPEVQVPSQGTLFVMIGEVGGQAGEVVEASIIVSTNPLDFVLIDIKPGSDPNCFNTNGHGVIPVAILGSTDFDVADVVINTLSFSGLEVRSRGNGLLWSFEYSNEDEILDLVCHFEDEPDNWMAGAANATLTGELLDGTSFIGSDSICIVPSKDYLIQITSDPASDGAPSWSPDGTSILFDSERSGSGSIWMMNVNGKKKIQLTDDLGFDYQPHWNSEGTKIVFYSYRSGGIANIWEMDSDGSNLIQLTTGPAIDGSPDYSPDGSQIVFPSNRSGNRDIWIMDSDGSNLIQLTNDPASDNSPDYSPDGSQIVFHSNRSGNSEIWIMNSDGSNQYQLTNTLEHEGHAHFSSDGSQIVFHSERTGNREIWIMSRDGSNQTQITNHPDNDGGASWSPDGKSIVFRSNRTGNNDIWIYSLH